MTRREFIDDVTTWHGLLRFCYDNDCTICEDVYEESDRDEIIDGELVDMARETRSWRDLLDELDNIPTNYDAYERSDYGWEGTDSGDYTFNNYKDDVLSWMDENDCWDEDDEGDEDIDDDEVIPEETFYNPTSNIENDEDDVDNDEIETEDISIGDLFTIASGQLQNIKDTEKHNNCEENDDEYADFVMGVVAIVEGK